MKEFISFSAPSSPAIVTRRQARQALLLAGLLDQVQPVIAAIPDETERRLTQIAWGDSTEFQRYDAFLIKIGQALSLTPEQIDQLFITAASL